MISDRIFFPLFVLIVSLLIYAAFELGPRASGKKGPLSGDPLNGFIVAGDDLVIMGNGPGLVREFIDDPIDGKFVRTAAAQRPNQGVASAGTFLALLPDIGQAWQGHTVFVSVMLRRPKFKGSKDVMLRYYAVGHGNGKPVRCEVSENWSPCYMSHFVKTSDKPPNMSFIGIWPDIKGLSRFVDISRIEVRIDTPIVPQENNLRQDTQTSAPKTND